MAKRIILMSIGTRGDMEPFLAIGELLASQGHNITCAFPEQFRSLAEDAGFAFESLGSEFIEMLDSPAGRIAMGGGSFGWAKMKAYAALIKLQQDINKNMVLRQYEIVNRLAPDHIVHAGKAMYPVIWSVDHPDCTTLISPVPYIHYVKNHSHVMINKDLGPWLNKLTYKLANYGLVKTAAKSVTYLPGVNVSNGELRNRLLNSTTAYAISPTLFARPDYWPERLQVLGYHERNKTTKWKPSQELADFLAKHHKVLLVTFGSMVNRNPTKNTQIILNVLQKLKIPAIINTAAGGLVKPDHFTSENLLFVDRIPYDWVFPKVYGVIHHGGSGTTHTALKYGCANLILPHIIDQYVWNSRIAELKAGPLGTDISKISSSNLSDKVVDLWDNESYKKKAEQLGTQIQKEDLADDLIQFILREK